jgi:hypothetical protein
VPDFYRSSDEEEILGSIIDMKLGDCFAFGRDAREDAGWGATYRVIQAMHKNIIGEDCPCNLDYITDSIPAKSAAKEEALEPLDAQIFFNSLDYLPKGIMFKAFKYTRNNIWRSAPVSRLNMYGALPQSTLREYFTDYFSAPNPRMLMVTDGASTFGVYGYKDCEVYVMNPEDWKMLYCDSLTEQEKNDESPCAHAANSYFNAADSQNAFQPLLKVPIEKFDVTNFCVLQCQITPKRIQKQKDEGVAPGTDSESNSDSELVVEAQGKTRADLSQVKWTPKLELTLEEILIRNQFDFKLTAKEF